MDDRSLAQFNPRAEEDSYAKPHVPIGPGLSALDDDWELPVCNRGQSGDTTCESCQ